MSRNNHLAGALACLSLGIIYCMICLGCEAGLPAGDEPHREFNFINMYDQPKLKPQRGGLLAHNSVGALAPPEGAVAQGEYPYPHSQKQGELAARQKNPLKATPGVLANGKWHFDNICIVCHGPRAAGDGEVAKLFPAPPSLMTQKVRDWSDGRIYHVPMRGQGSMPSHTRQITRRDLWAVVLYIRSLQKKLPVAPPPKKKTRKAAPGGEK